MDIKSLDVNANLNNLQNNIPAKIEVNQKETKAESGEDKHPVTEKEVKKAVDKLNKLIEDKKTHVEYEMYGKQRTLTIRIVDDIEKKVIKELPPKKVIDMVDKLCELAGLFVEKKV